MLTLSARYSLLAPRATYWALLGAVSGLIAYSLIWVYFRYGGYMPTLGKLVYPLPALILPGLIFGLAVGLALRRKGLAEWWQSAALTVVSILAGTHAATLSLTDFTDVFAGVFWAAVQAGGTAAIFSFARRRISWIALAALGGGVAVALAKIMEPLLGHYMGAYWPVLYALHAAILSTVLPVCTDSGRLPQTAAPRPPADQPHTESVTGKPTGAGIGYFDLMSRRPWRWAGLGALSGALAQGAIWPLTIFLSLCLWLAHPELRIIYWDYPYSWHPLKNVISPTLISPGLAFAIVAGIALWRQGLARKWQIAALIAVSILAWSSGYLSIGLINPRPLDPSDRGYTDLGLVIGPAVNVGWPVLLGGLVWGGIQAIGTAAIFPFARRSRLWFAFIAAGSLTAWLAVEVNLLVGIPGYLFLVLWTSWYAAHAAILSTALPMGKD